MVSTHWKNIRQIGSFPQLGVKIKNIWNHHLDHGCCFYCSFFKPWYLNHHALGLPHNFDLSRQGKPFRLGRWWLQWVKSRSFWNGLFLYMNDLHPGRLTWNLKMMVWKMIFFFNWVIFRFHVNLPGCINGGGWSSTTYKSEWMILQVVTHEASRKLKWANHLDLLNRLFCHDCITKKKHALK